MGWLDDILSNLGKTASKHEELLGAIPLIAGSALLARNGRAGGPIGAGLTTLGGLMEAPYFLSQPQGKDSTVQITGPQGNTQYGTRNDLTGKTSWWGTGVTPVQKSAAPKFDYWFQKGPNGQIINEQELPQGSPRPGSDWFTPAGLKGGGGEGNAFALWKQGHPNGTWEEYQADLAQTKSAGGKPTISWRWETGPDGRAIQRPYKYDVATNTEVPVPTPNEPAGLPARLNASEQKQVDAINEVVDTLPVVQQTLAALPPNLSRADFVKEYAKYRSGGLAGTPDPRFTDYFDLLGQLQTSLIAARIGGLSRSQQIINQLKPHIPSPTDLPDVALRKLQDFNKGAFQSSLTAILGPNAPKLPPMTTSSASSAPPPAPSFGVAKTFRKGDEWVVQSATDGRYYEFDSGSNAWQPLGGGK